jgi:hypothetical protein
MGVGIDDTGRGRRVASFFGVGLGGGLGGGLGIGLGIGLGVGGLGVGGLNPEGGVHPGQDGPRGGGGKQFAAMDAWLHGSFFREDEVFGPQQAPADKKTDFW